MLTHNTEHVKIERCNSSWIKYYNYGKNKLVFLFKKIQINRKTDFNHVFGDSAWIWIFPISNSSYKISKQFH